MAAKSIARPASAAAFTLPDYILERNRLATKAGLVIAKQVIVDGEATTWYEGSEAQWRASPFCNRRPDRPFVRSKMRDFGCSTLSRYLEVRGVSDDWYRGTIANEALPEWTELLGDGIAAYGMRNGRAVAYVGKPEALIARKIAPPEIESETWGRAHDKNILHFGGSIVGFMSGNPVIWNRYAWDGGRCLFWDYVAVREKVALEEADKHKRAFKNASHMLGEWATIAGAHLRACRDQFARVETTNGKTMTLTRESLDSIDEAVVELLDAIRGAQVVERDVVPAQLRQKAGRARADAAFQAFLSESGVATARD